MGGGPMTELRAPLLAARSTFVECGPAVAVSRKAWACLWGLLQGDLGSGYGLDLVWSRACAPGSTFLLAGERVWHRDGKEASGKHPNFHALAVAEGAALFGRLGLAPEMPRVLELVEGAVGGRDGGWELP